MAGREKPPGGPPGQGPGGGDDEYRSVVFDESFVDAARLQEFSARERLEDEEHAAVQSRAPRPETGRRGAARSGLTLLMVIVLAYAFAVYMGVRNTAAPPPPAPAQPVRMATFPLTPRGAVPGSTPEDLFAHSPAADFRTGADGVTLPVVERTENFTENQILAALTVAKEYVVTSSLDPAVLTGGDVRQVRLMLDPDQLGQFEQSVDRPRSDGRHAATGWMVRFDPDRVELAAPDVRVNGTLAVEETGRSMLEVTADHVFVYALRDAANGPGGEASLFTVRREVRFHLARDDLTEQELRVRSVTLRAGPMACSADHAEMLTPLMAGERAQSDRTPGTDPYVLDRSHGVVCGVLAASARPEPTGTR
jgi:hypothetical protein